MVSRLKLLLLGRKRRPSTENRTQARHGKHVRELRADVVFSFIRIKWRLAEILSLGASAPGRTQGNGLWDFNPRRNVAIS